MSAHAFADIVDTTGFFYYIAMQKFERNEAKKKRKKHSSVTRRVLPSEKSLLMMQGKQKELIRSFDFSSTKQHFRQQSLHVESYEDLIQLLAQVNIGECFTPSIKLNTFITCPLFKGNYAWISRNSKGHYRYFSKRKDQELVICFDFLDFAEIYYGVGTYKAIDKIVKMFGIQFMEERWKKDRKLKYWRNEQFLNESLQQYPHLSALLYEYRPLIEVLNALGNYYIYKKEYSYKNENMFFASTSHIATFLQTSNTSKINQLINLLATVGFIEKIPTSHIHPLFLKESADIVDKRALGNRINYYIVHSFQKVASVAEERAKILLKNGISYSRISKISIEKLFGTEFAESIYPQIIQKNKKRETDKKENIEALLEENFFYLLTEQGYVTKTMVANLPVFDLSFEKKQSYLKKIWTYLLHHYNCKYEKPTKEKKAQMDLTNYEYIAYP